MEKKYFCPTEDLASNKKFLLRDRPWRILSWLEREGERVSLSCPGWGRGSWPGRGYPILSRRGVPRSPRAGPVTGLGSPSRKNMWTRGQGKNLGPEAIGTPFPWTDTRVCGTRAVIMFKKNPKKQQNSMQEELKSGNVWNKFLYCLSWI